MSRPSQHYGTRAELRVMVDRLAPASPPCFSAREQWIEFLVAAQEDQTLSDRHAGHQRYRRAPIDFRFTEGPRFNRSFDY